MSQHHQSRVDSSQQGKQDHDRQRREQTGCILHQPAQELADHDFCSRVAWRAGSRACGARAPGQSTRPPARAPARRSAQPGSQPPRRRRTSRIIAASWSDSRPPFPRWARANKLQSPARARSPGCTAGDSSSRGGATTRSSQSRIGPRVMIIGSQSHAPAAARDPRRTTCDVSQEVSLDNCRSFAASGGPDELKVDRRGGWQRGRVLAPAGCRKSRTRGAGRTAATILLLRLVVAGKHGHHRTQRARQRAAHSPGAIERAEPGERPS